MSVVQEGGVNGLFGALFDDEINWLIGVGRDGGMDFMLFLYAKKLLYSLRFFSILR